MLQLSPDYGTFYKAKSDSSLKYESESSGIEFHTFHIMPQLTIYYESHMQPYPMQVTMFMVSILNLSSRSNDDCFW